LIVAVFLIFALFGSGVYLYMNRAILKKQNMFVVYSVLFGCMMNCGYVFLSIPMNLSNGYCIGQFWTNHIGFAIGILHT